MSQNTSPEIAAENLEKKKFVFLEDEILDMLNSKDMSESTRNTYKKRLVRVCEILENKPFTIYEVADKILDMKKKKDKTCCCTITYKHSCLWAIYKILDAQEADAFKKYIINEKGIRSTIQRHTIATKKTELPEPQETAAFMYRCNLMFGDTSLHLSWRALAYLYKTLPSQGGSALRPCEISSVSLIDHDNLNYIDVERNIMVIRKTKTKPREIPLGAIFMLFINNMLSQGHVWLISQEKNMTQTYTDASLPTILKRIFGRNHDSIRHCVCTYHFHNSSDPERQCLCDNNGHDFRTQQEFYTKT